MEKRLVKNLLKRANYEDCSEHLTIRLFSSDIRELYQIIEIIYKNYEKINEIDKELLREIYLQNNPALSDAKKRVVVNLIDDICNEDDLDPSLAKDFISTIWKRDNARQVAEEALKVINGESNSLDGITQVVSGFQAKEESTNKAYKEIPFDLDSLLIRTSHQGLFKFRLPSLAAAVPGAGRGNFVVTFARPESGKTTFMVSEAAGYLKQGLKVSYFMNEEPAYRVYMRLICSALECSEQVIRESPEDAKKAFSSLAANLRMHDAVGMDLAALDAYCLRNRPDVLILDQLDKVHVDGSYARDDLKLGAVYVGAREIAKKYECLVYGVSQASAEADGLCIIHYSMLAGSKTGKPAEADLIIGIGKSESIDADDPIRTLTISKNKINGYHGSINCVIDQEKAMYNV